MIVVLDFGMGNIASILNMLRKVGTNAKASSDVRVIEDASHLVLPGVGAFDAGMDSLEKRGILPVLNDKVVKQRTPTLGICLGMQLLGRGSEEGHAPGLGWIEAQSVRFAPREHIRIPHMGWNTVRIVNESPLLQGMGEASRFYFVHSYHMVCDRREDVLTETTHGESFVSSLRSGNIYGVQFHPEKSHRFGMQLLRNFADVSC